ncbi:hypothetical protein RRU01S_36_00040 [Agrobacterium rubi TR3 = NBRC 13261]|uniref:Uncharacterized protein n=1 Tax=Agrobacterium rubi TR3 = NBRC 13261 TaxID=1368415 RepID=A0A081D344_9HYPH|nr:hypothetical protein [Agrobacterium rubi]MBP1881552.1 hypothetical protein [Agrobacterium rubi]GAK73340.1 hypothetical protein RRU01S_36_00040 [Agrobacterium rubi TR3 = NBRC 13261]
MTTIAAIHFGHSHLAAGIPFLYNRELATDKTGKAIEHYVFDVYNNRNIFHQDETKLHYGIIEGGRILFNPELLDRVRARIAPDREIVYISTFGGNAHNALTLLHSARAYDFILPSEPDLLVDDNLELIPHAAVHDAIEHNCKNFLLDLEGLRNSVDADVYHVISPPTIQNDALVGEIVANDTILAQTGTLVTASLTRYKAWRVHSEIFAAKCEQIGAKVLYPPSSAMKDDMWLAEDCIGGDPTHGNLSYYGLMFQEIEKTLGGHFAGWDFIR